MKMKSLHDLYVDELRDLYSAENQLLKALPKMGDAASALNLRTAFSDHLAETRGQVARLEKIFKKLNASPRGKKCKAMEGLIEAGKEVIDEQAAPAVTDSSLIVAGQRVEHYEMAHHGYMCTLADLMGYPDTAKLLQDTLDEERSADKKLAGLALTCTNPKAIAHDGRSEAEPTQSSRATKSPNKAP